MTQTKTHILAAIVALAITVITFHQAIAVPADAPAPLAAQQLLA